jgi:hypothetical protein
MLRTRLHADLAAQKTRWDTEADAIGLVKVDRQEMLAWERRETLAFRAFSLPALDLTGIITKLTLILRMGEARESDDQFPWPQIDSVIADLQRLAEARTVA